MYIAWPICGGTSQTAATQQFAGMSGYRGLGCGCGCGGMCQGRGLGQTVAGVNLFGTGDTYFGSGWDISGWGIAEWGTVLVGVYIAFSVFSTTKRGYRRASRSYRRVKTAPQRRARERAERLRSEARRLEEGAGSKSRRDGGF